MRYYNSLGAGTHRVVFDFKRTPVLVEEIHIECDNPITIKDNLNLLGGEGSVHPLPLSGGIQERVRETIGIPRLEFTVVTTVTTKVWIKLSVIEGYDR